MSKPDKTLDPKILDAAKKEFLEKGYEKASTNAICKSAGVTWGALQKRYSGKDALFCALVAPVAEEFKATLIGSNEDFHAQTKEQQEATALHEGRDGNPFVDYIYAHFDVFRLLLCCAGGSSYEHYMDDLVDSIFGDDDEDEDEDEDDDGAFETSYEVTCPNCGTVNIVDEDTLMDSDKIVCAECGAAFDVEVLPDDAEMPADAEAESTDVTIE